MPAQDEVQVQRLLDLSHDFSCSMQTGALSRERGGQLHVAQEDATAHFQGDLAKSAISLRSRHFNNEIVALPQQSSHLKFKRRSGGLLLS